MKLKDKYEVETTASAEQIKILAKDKELLTTEVDKLSVVIETLMGRFPQDKIDEISNANDGGRQSKQPQVKFAEKNLNQQPSHFKYSLKHDFPVVHRHWITCCACTPDQKFIFTVSNDRTMKQWSTQLLTLFLDWGVIHDGFVYQIKITPSGSHA
jgi:WD40 repeat protein